MCLTVNIKALIFILHIIKNLSTLQVRIFNFNKILILHFSDEYISLDNIAVRLERIDHVFRDESICHQLSRQNLC